MSKIRVAVIFGGASSEHEVSLVSATSVIKNIPQDKYEVICIGINSKGRWFHYPGNVDLIATGEWENHPDCTPAILSPDPIHNGFITLLDGVEASFQRVDCIFPVLHGKNGEDGTIQGLFMLSEIPYVGCNTLSSAICMDKDITHTILEYRGIKTAKWETLLYPCLSSLDIRCDEIESSLGYPVFVKPANCGSSIGVSKASNREELAEAIKLAFTHDKKVIVEQEIIGQEVECAVLGMDKPMASVVGEIVPCNEFYDYDAKYILNESELNIPAKISDRAAKEVQDIAIKAFKALGCSGLARVDCFVTAKDEVIVNEINTLPGFTSISMYPKMIEASGIPYPELLDRLIEIAFERADKSYG